LVIALSLLLSACGAVATTVPAPPTARDSTRPGNTVAPPATTAPARPTVAAPAATTAPAATVGASAPKPPPSGSIGEGGRDVPANHSQPYPTQPPQPPVQQEPLKAGTVDDNLKYDEYMQFIRNFRGQNFLPFDVTERYVINVMDGNARTVANANVKVFDGQNLLFDGKTYSNGQVLFFPRAIAKAAQSNEFEVYVEKNGNSSRKTFKRSTNNGNQNQSSSNVWTLEMSGSMRPQLDSSPNLDLLFLLDSTGSMGGEIRKIQQTISDISYQISTLPNSPKVRYGVVTYRDRGDSYVTRKFGFTENLGQFSDFLNSISAGGGGDTPESLNEALHVAINDMNWNGGDAVRLTFLVADAPPHLDYNNDYRYTDELVQAVKKGIKVYAIGASGLDKQGEYVFRQLAQITLAQFLFITRGGDEKSPGSGGPASNTDVVYQERDLDRIVVNIVRRELTNLNQ
jgi:hypothetical protein